MSFIWIKVDRYICKVHLNKIKCHIKQSYILVRRSQLSAVPRQHFGQGIHKEARLESIAGIWSAPKGTGRWRSVRRLERREHRIRTNIQILLGKLQSVHSWPARQIRREAKNSSMVRQWTTVVLNCYLPLVAITRPIWVLWPRGN